jgi:hypothetical protein
MADSATHPTHEGTGHYDEKAAAPAPYQPKPKVEDDEDEDIDALIEDLESQDGHQDDEEEENVATPGGKAAWFLNRSVLVSGGFGCNCRCKSRCDAI